MRAHGVEAGTAGPGSRQVLERARLALVTAGLSPWAIAVSIAVVLALVVLAGAYGWHRDELYFVVAGRHPALGYPDQPPLTPLLDALGVAILGPSPIAVRVLPALVTGLAIVLSIDMARRFGGGGRAQLVAALSLTASGFLFAGHLGSTATFDLAFWTVIVWLVVRILGGGDPRLWLAVGAVGGLAFENKHLVVLLAIGLVIGLVLARRWDVIRSRYAWAGAAIAVLLALPNVLWQAANGWPALEMASAIADRAEDRATFLVELILLSGSSLAFIPALGLVRLLVRRDTVAWRPIGWAALVVFVLIVVSEGKSYYAMGILPALTAAGAVAVERWLDRGVRWPKLATVGVAGAVSIALMAVLTLPIVPAASLASTPIPEINAEQGEQVGWPELVDSVRGAVDSLSPSERASAVILTSNYGEAAALEILDADLPPVYSGHNGYWDWGPPTDGRSAAILVGPASFQAAGVGDCGVAATIRNAAGVHNQEWGYQVRVCRQVPVSFAPYWPMYRHLD